MKKKIFGVIISLVVIALAGAIIFTMTSPKIAFNKSLDNMIHHLNVKKSEKLNFELEIKTSGDNLYNVLNNSIIKGSYISSDDFKLKMDYTSNYKETININLYNKDNITSFDDEYSYKDVISIDSGKFDLSLNNFKNNLKKVLSTIKDSNIEVTGKTNKSNNITSFTINKDIFSNINLDYPYNNMFDAFKEYVDGAEVKIYSNVFTGALDKIEIKNDDFISIAKTEEGYYFELITKDNEMYKVTIDENKITYTKSKGSTTLSTIEIFYRIDKDDVDLSNIDISKAVPIEKIEISKLKQNINESKTKKEIVNLYYSIINKPNIVDMTVSGYGYYVYYKVPDKYVNNYSGKSSKRYINVNQKILYMIKNYMNSDMDNYINETYNNEIASNYYKQVFKSSTEEIEHNGIKFYYQVITKSYDYSYSDYDDTKSTAYIWTNLDDNNIFCIEYDFQGSKIENYDIIELLDIEIGK